MKNINTEWTIDQLISLNEHKALNPPPGSYQQQCRDALSRLSTTQELYVGVANTIDWLSWKADKQVRGLKDQIAWLRELNHNIFAGEVTMGDIKKDLQILSNWVDGLRQKVFFLSSASRVGHDDEDFLDPDSMKGLSRILDGVGLDVQYMAEHLNKTMQKM